MCHCAYARGNAERPEESRDIDNSADQRPARKLREIRLSISKETGSEAGTARGKVPQFPHDKGEIMKLSALITAHQHRRIIACRKSAESERGLN